MAEHHQRQQDSQMDFFHFEQLQKLKIIQRLTYKTPMQITSILPIFQANQFKNVNQQQFQKMKEEKKAKQMREKIKERMNKKGMDREEGLMSEKIERIGQYNVYIGDPIGQGSYGKVYKAKRDDGELLACKIISKARLENLKLYDQSYASEMQSRFRTQSEFHKQLSGCSNVVKLIETIENNKAYYFIMQYCESDLSKIIKENGILAEEVALKYFSEMLEGYKSIYEKNAFHRDLKPENLLIKDDVVKISDFGFVKIFNEIDLQCKSGKNKLRTQSKVGSIRYMAPDVLSLAMPDNDNDTKTYNAEKCDMWSMGIILYKMLYGKQPFNGKNQEQMMKKINEKQLQFPDTVELSPQIIRNAKVSPQIKKVIKKMINKDESSRITFKKLYSTINSYLKSKEIEKMSSGIKEQEDKEKKEGEAKNKKEELLIFYNKIIIKLYYDAVNYSTLESIGVPNFYETTFKLMYYIHKLREKYLETQKQGEENFEVSPNLAQQISNFHNIYIQGVKQTAKIQEKQKSIMKPLLITIYEKIKIYPQFELLLKEVEIFLIDLLLLLSLRLKIVKPDYVYTWTVRCDNYKQKVILNYKQNTLTMLERRLSEKQEEDSQEKEEEKHKKRKDKTREKEKKHKSKGKDLEKENAVENEQKEPQEKEKKDKSQDKHKDRSSRQKKSRK